MTVHELDEGTIVSQRISDVDDITGIVVTLVVVGPLDTRQQGVRTEITGSNLGPDTADPDQLERVGATVSSAVWTEPGQYLLQFQCVLGGEEFALDETLITVKRRL